MAVALLLRRTHRRATAMMDDALRPLGVESRHVTVLRVLVDHGPAAQWDLGAATGSDKTTIMRIVDELVRRGLAVRRPIPGDRRARAVKVTPQGAGVADAAHAAAGQLAERRSPN
ncbi:MarR family transcriptional regulator [Streptomyces sp. NBC_00510]